jgi:PAS domain S-box-containing protein
LSAEKTRWQGLFERMQEGFFIGEAIRDEVGHMHDFRFIEVNPAFEALTGLKPHETVGRSVREAIPGIQGDLIATYERVVTTGQPTQFEVHVPALGGRWYEARARAEGPERFAVLFLEITARKKAEEAVQERTAALARSEGRWRGLFEGMQEGFFLGEAVRDSTGRMIDLRFVEVNPAFETLTGMQAHATVGRTALEFAPGGQGKLIGTYAKVIDTGQAQRFEAQVSSLNSRWYEVSAGPAGPDQVAVLFVEVTARKQAEEQARAGAALLKATVDNLDQGLIMFDASETIQVFNARAAELLDIPAEYLATHPTFSELVQRRSKRMTLPRTTRCSAIGLHRA